jgi:hypothetical protein
MGRLEPPYRRVIKTLLHFILFGSSGRVRGELSLESSNCAHIVDACTFATTGDIARPPLRMEDMLAMCHDLVVITRVEFGDEESEVDDKESEINDEESEVDDKESEVNDTKSEVGDVESEAGDENS